MDIRPPAQVERSKPPDAKKAAAAQASENGGGSGAVWAAADQCTLYLGGVPQVPPSQRTLLDLDKP